MKKIILSDLFFVIMKSMEGDFRIFSGFLFWFLICFKFNFIRDIY